jgi:cobalt-precorrin 5A hydrolase
MLRPREFSVGIGCKKGASVKEVEKAVKAAFRVHGLSALSIRNLATIDIKKTEQGILDYATKARLSIEFYGVAELNIKKPPSGVSQAALKNTGAFAVAEPSALLSSGAKRLWFKKIRTRNITLAAAKASFQ